MSGILFHHDKKERSNLQNFDFLCYVSIFDVPDWHTMNLIRINYKIVIELNFVLTGSYDYRVFKVFNNNCSVPQNQNEYVWQYKHTMN